MKINCYKSIPYSKKNILILLLGLLFAQPSFSQTRSERAKNFFKQSLLKSSSLSEVKLSVKYESPAFAKKELTIYQNQSGGFVLISGNDNSNFIIGYSENGTLEIDDAPPSFKSLIEFYESEDFYFEKNLLKGSTTYPPIAPLLDSKGISLRQYSHSEFDNAPSGCVATAFAQIMAYHQYPMYGEGSYCFTHPKYGELCSDFENTYYNWESMNEEDYKNLSRQLGIAMNMNYAISGSYPTRGNYEYVLEDYFKYSAYKGSSEFDDIYYELVNKRPVFITIYGESGHALVIDGVDVDGKYHLNFGWGGLNNGYFQMPGLPIIDNAGRVYRSVIASIVYVSTSPFHINETDLNSIIEISKGLNELFGWDQAVKYTRWPGLHLSKGRVVGISLGNRDYPIDYKCSISPEVANLSELKNFTLHAFIEDIDLKPFCQLKNLETLYITNSSYSDTKAALPEEINELGNLKTLDISFLIEGKLPDNIGELQSLETLNLNNNNISDNIPESIGNLNKLRILNINHSNLSSTLPESIGNLSNLETLSLYFNNISGPIPISITNLTKLTELSLYDNKLTGILPADIGNLTSLSYFNIQNNELEGEVPPSIGNFANSLVYFNIYNNKFTSIPNEIGNFKISRLNVSNNLLTYLPDSISKLDLSSINASNNNITKLTENFGNWKNLVSIDMSNNKITLFPVELCYLNNLDELNFANNLITHLPNDIQNLANVNVLNFLNNEIQGDIPKDLLSNKIEWFNLALNRFTYDNIPESNIYRNGIGYQKEVSLTDSIIKVFPNKETIIDIRELTGLSNPDNEYYWFEYPTNKGDYYIGYDDIESNPLLKINMLEGDSPKKYYCRILNNSAPTYDFEPGLYFELIRYLESEALTISVMNEKEQLLSLYPESFLLYSDDLIDKTIKDEKVTLVSPFKKRGSINWEISIDKNSWNILSKEMSDIDLYDNVFSLSDDELVINPQQTAWYRCVLQEGNCDPLISEEIKISPYEEELLYEEIINVKNNSLSIIRDSIEVIIPAGFADHDFKLTISKIHDAPEAPEGYKLSSVYDVSTDLQGDFEYPIEIILRNIDVSEIEDFKIPEIKAVYYDETIKEWVEFEYGGVSYKHDGVYFSTHHLTKLGFFEWLKDPQYSHKLESEKVNIIYRYVEGSPEISNYNIYHDTNYKMNNFMPWHNSNCDPDKGGTPLLIQDIAEFMKQIITKFDSLGLNNFQVRKKFTVYVKNTDSGLAGIRGFGEAYGFITAAGYSDAYFYINTLLAIEADVLKKTLAHEYMHFIQSAFVDVKTSNYFFAEAHAPLADRMVWSADEMKDTEPEINLMKARKTIKNLSSIFDLLAKPWDDGSYSFIPLIEKFTVDSYDANISSAFLHYMRTYSKIKLDAAKLLKDAMFYYPLSSSWRTYINSYLDSNHSTTIGDEYDDYIRYILSGDNKNFTLLNTEEGNPFTYLLGNIKSQNKGSYVDKLNWNILDEEYPEEAETIEFNVPYLASKILFLNNNNNKNPLIIEYKRINEVNEYGRVYYGYYNYEDKKVMFEEITDSLNYSILLEAKDHHNSERYNNTSFLLFVNKKCPSIINFDNNFNAKFTIKAMPIINIQDLVIARVGNAPIHIFSNGNKEQFIISGNMNYSSISAFWNFKISNYENYKQLIDNNTVVTEAKFQNSYEVQNGPYLPTSLISNDVWQTIFYNYLTGDLTIIQNNINIQKYGAYTDEKGKEHSEYTHLETHLEQKLELKDVLNFETIEYEALNGSHHDFETINTEHTLEILINMSETFTSIRYDNEGNIIDSGTNSYEYSDFSDPDIKINLKFHYK